MKTYEVELLQSDSVYLVNAIVTEKRVECGVAVIMPFTGDRAFLLNQGLLAVVIEIPEYLQNKPTAIALTSKDDDISFTVIPTNVS